MQQFSSKNWFTQQWKSESSCCSAMEGVTGLQFHYVNLQWIQMYLNNILKQNSLKAIVFQFQTSHELHVYNFTML